MSVTPDPYYFLPPIRRARGWRLYARDGRRFLDLWQDGGRSVLGAKPARLATEVKALVDRGLDRGLPSTESERLDREISRRWPAYVAHRVYRSEEAALAALFSAVAARGPEARRGAAAGGSLPPRDLVVDSGGLLLDPARRRAESAGGPPEALLLRPFAASLSAAAGTAAETGALGEPSPSEGGGAAAAPGNAAPSYAIPLLPCPRAFAPCIVLARDEAAAAELPPSDLLSPLAAHAALQCLHALDRHEAERGEELWRRADRRLRPHFERKGPYLFARDHAGWEERAARAREAGIVLPLDPALPALLPGDFDDGELAALASALAAAGDGARGAPITR